MKIEVQITEAEKETAIKLFMRIQKRVNGLNQKEKSFFFTQFLRHNHAEMRKLKEIFKQPSRWEKVKNVFN